MNKNSKINVISNIGTTSGLSSFSRSFVKHMSQSYDMALPLFGQGHLPNVIQDSDIASFAKLLKGNRISDLDIIIGPPNTWNIKPNSKTIGVFGHGCNRIPARDINMHPSMSPEIFNWVKQCNKVTTIWTFSQESRNAIMNTGVTVPVKVIPGFIDTEFWKPNSPLPKDGINGITQFNGFPIEDKDRKFVVCYVAEFSKRKEILTFLKCCMVGLPFDKTTILLKTGSNNPNCRPGLILDIIAKFKQSMKLPRLPNIVVIDDPVSDSDIRGLIQSADLYISTSRGDALDRSLLQAMSMGKVVIAGTSYPHTSIIKDNENGLLCNSTLEVVCNQDDEVNGISTSYFSDQLWSKINEIDLIRKMQEVFQVWTEDNTLKIFDKLKESARSTVESMHGIDVSVKTVDKELKSL